MTPNMGTADRIIRVVVAIVFAGLIATGQVSGILAIVLGVLAGILVLTSLVSTCPLYLPFGISTRPRHR